MSAHGRSLTILITRERSGMFTASSGLESVMGPSATGAAMDLAERVIGAKASEIELVATAPRVLTAYHRGARGYAAGREQLLWWIFMTLAIGAGLCWVWWVAMGGGS